MELHNGFVVGVYNYCDRWCARCAFTSRCAVFADVAKMQAMEDPQMKAIADAPPAPEDVPPPPPRWLQELIDDMNEAAEEPLTEEEIERLRPRVAPEHKEIEARARGYALHLRSWLGSREGQIGAHAKTAEPIEVIRWFEFFIAAKVHRALCGLSDDEWMEDDGPRDSDGSAKAALIGIDRSHAAWLEMVEAGALSMTDIEPFLTELVWIGEALERVCPHARRFVRSGFDEPEEVAKLDQMVDW